MRMQTTLAALCLVVSAAMADTFYDMADICESSTAGQQEILEACTWLLRFGEFAEHT